MRSLRRDVLLAHGALEALAPNAIPAVCRGVAKHGATMRIKYVYMCVAAQRGAFIALPQNFDGPSQSSQLVQLVQLVHEVTSRERDAQLRRQAVVLGDSDDGEEDQEEDAAGARAEGTAKKQRV